MLKRLALIALPLALATACAAPQPSNFAPPTAGEIGPEPDNYGEAVIPAKGVIVVQGDDLVYGTAERGGRPPIEGTTVRRTGETITETLRRVLRTPTVINRGYPADTVVQGAARWMGEPPGNLLILSYGFGDARARTPVETYVATLRGLIQRAHAAGAAVFVVLTPTSTDPAQAAAVAPYEFAAMAVGGQEGAEVFNPNADLARLATPAAKGVAQTPKIYRLVAGSLAPYIKTVPQTGQAGSGGTPIVRVSAARAS